MRGGGWFPFSPPEASGHVILSAAGAKDLLSLRRARVVVPSAAGAKDLLFPQVRRTHVRAHSGPHSCPPLGVLTPCPPLHNVERGTTDRLSFPSPEGRGDQRGEDPKGEGERRTGSRAGVTPTPPRGDAPPPPAPRRRRARYSSRSAPPGSLSSSDPIRSSSCGSGTPPAAGTTRAAPLPRWHAS